VNFSGQAASGFINFPEGFWQGWSRIVLRDEMVEPVKNYPRSAEELESRGLYVLLGPHEFHFFKALTGERT
jgi:hypothetical protein